MLHVILNHETQLFRVVVNERTVGRFETVEVVDGVNGRWYLLTGPRVVYVLDKGGCGGGRGAGV